MSDINRESGDAEANQADDTTAKLQADGTTPPVGEYPAAAKPGNSRLVPSGPEGGTDAGTNPPKGQPGDNVEGP
jgi:hypothetical protein